MRVRGGDDDVGGEASVGFTPQQSDRRRVFAVVAVDRWVDQRPAAEQVCRYVCADRDHEARDVAALYPRETDRATPARLGVGLAWKAVGALAGPDVCVVDCGCANANEYLAGAGGRHGPVESYLEGVGSTVASQNRSRHHLIHLLILKPEAAGTSLRRALGVMCRVVGESESRLVEALVLHGWDRFVESLRTKGVQQRARCAGELVGQEAAEQRAEMRSAVRHDRVQAFDAVQRTHDGQAVGSGAR
jgi:hypothetical protein